MAISPSAIYLLKRKSSTGVKFSGSIPIRLLDLLKYYCKIKKIKFYYLSEKKILRVKFINNSYVFFSRYIFNEKTMHYLNEKKIRKKLKLIADIDDLIWDRSAPDYKMDELVFKQTIDFLKKADLILFSNTFLQKSFFKNLHTKVKSYIIPPYLHATEYNNYIIKNKKIKKLILYSKLGFFPSAKKKMFEKLLSIICEEFKLKVLCISQHKLNIKKKFLIYKKPMEFKKFIKTIFSKNILFAVVPVGDNKEKSTSEWNSGKSYVKYLFYANAGIPTIFSKTPPYNKIIKHSYNGLLTKNTFASWYKNLKLFSTNEELRMKIRHNALINTLSNYNIHEGFLNLDKALKKL